MRKFAMIAMMVIALVMMASPMVFAQNPLKVVVPDQSTIGWDAVTTLGNGDVIPAGEIVGYEVYLGPHPIPAGQSPDDASLYMFLGATTEITYLIAFPVEGVYIAGVRAVRTMDNVDSYSSISWSTNPLRVTTPWYYVFITPYAWPTGLSKL